jgi:hypothetical protein
LRLKKSNVAILHVFNIAISALEEPSYHWPNWVVAVNKISQVVPARFYRTRALQQELNLSNDEIYGLVLKHTLILASELEKLSIQPGLERLFVARGEHNEHCGPLILSSINKHEDEVARQLCLRFINDFAKARDEITKEF